MNVKMLRFSPQALQSRKKGHQILYGISKNQKFNTAERMKRVLETV